MSVPIPAMTTRAVVSLMPGIVVRRLTAARKGSSASPLRASIAATALDGVDLGQVQSDHEPMMVGDTSVKRVPQVGARRFQPSWREIDESIGIRLAGDQCIEDRPAAHANDVAHDLRELQVRVFERLLNPQHKPGDFMDELPAHGVRSRSS